MGVAVSAGSYRDFTRVAYLDAEMWTELFLENRDNLKYELDVLIAELSKYSKALSDCDEQETGMPLRYVAAANPARSPTTPPPSATRASVLVSGISASAFISFRYCIPLAEVIKYGVLADSDLFNLLCDKAAASSQMNEIIDRCAEIKTRIVEEDEFDTGVRQLLNFGHAVASISLDPLSTWI